MTPELRRHCERRLGALSRERTSWFAHWRGLSELAAYRSDVCSLTATDTLLHPLKFQLSAVVALS